MPYHHDDSQSGNVIIGLLLLISSFLFNYVEDLDKIITLFLHIMQSVAAAGAIIMFYLQILKHKKENNKEN